MNRDTLIAEVVQRLPELSNKRLKILLRNFDRLKPGGLSCVFDQSQRMEDRNDADEDHMFGD